MTIGDALFGCRHQRMTFPMAVKPKMPHKSSAYVVCLDCGKEFGYDWQQMRLLGPLRRGSRRPTWTRKIAKRSTPIIAFVIDYLRTNKQKKEAA